MGLLVWLVGLFTVGWLVCFIVYGITFVWFGVCFDWFWWWGFGFDGLFGCLFVYLIWWWVLGSCYVWMLCCVVGVCCFCCFALHVCFGDVMCLFWLSGWVLLFGVWYLC